MNENSAFGEDIREVLHPAVKDFKVSIAMPDPLTLAQIADKFRAVKDRDTVGSVKVATDVLAGILRSVSSPTGQGAPLKAWATELFSSKYEFRRNDPVPIVVTDDVARDPVSLLPLKEGEYRTWQDPRTLRMHTVLWDVEKDAPILKPSRILFGNLIIEGVLFNVSGDDSGKDLPTLSAEQ